MENKRGTGADALLRAHTTLSDSCLSAIALLVYIDQLPDDGHSSGSCGINGLILLISVQLTVSLKRIKQQ